MNQEIEIRHLKLPELLHPSRWNQRDVPKHWQTTTDICYITTQKSKDLNKTNVLNQT